MSVQEDQLFGPEHVRVYRESGGAVGGLWKRGTSILLLTTRGSRTGEERTAPLIYRPDGDRWVIVASQGGAPTHPSWYRNIQAHPDEVSIQVGDEVIPVDASIAQGEERQRLWQRMAEVWPDYDAYARRTDREIPVVVLTRR
jgi:deazaflavin-dependent oxidoreductase (nitroreductase family)